MSLCNIIVMGGSEHTRLAAKSCVIRIQLGTCTPYFLILNLVPLEEIFKCSTAKVGDQLAPPQVVGPFISYAMFSVH